jgi:hypothetical protein
MNSLFTNLDYEIEECFTLNKVGVIGWGYRGKIAKQKAIGRFGLKVFNVMVPILKIIDPILPWKGLSLVVVARKSDKN